MGKRFELTILKPALDELLEIAHKHMELVGPQSARRITDKIRNTLDRLCVHPRMGMAMDDRELGRPGFRRIICGNYLCFYRLIGDAIVVYHIVDGRTDYPRLFVEHPSGDEQNSLESKK